MKLYPELEYEMGWFQVHTTGGYRYLCRWAEDEIGLPGWMLIKQLGPC